MEVSGQLHAPVAVPQGETRYPLDRRLGGPQNRFGHGGEEKNSQPLPGLEPPNIQPVAQRYTTTLFKEVLQIQVLAGAWGILLTMKPEMCDFNDGTSLQVIPMESGDEWVRTS
jgi:hypothetical protein